MVDRDAVQAAINDALKGQPSGPLQVDGNRIIADRMPAGWEWLVREAINAPPRILIIRS